MAVRIAKTKIIQIAQENVGRGSELNTICDDRLNLIVSQLYEVYKWPTNRKSGSVTLSDKTWTVPTDYLKANFLMVQNPNSDPITFFEVPIINYDDYKLGIIPNSTGRPQRASVLRIVDTTGTITLAGYVYPKPDQSYNATLEYTAIQTYDVADGDAPAFLDLQSLVDLLANQLRGMGYGTELGTPYDPFLLEKVVRRMRSNMEDDGIYPKRARLDRRIFRTGIYRGRFWGNFR